MILKFNVQNQMLVIHPSQAKLRLASDSRKYWVAKFDLRTEEWKNKIVFALFTFGERTYKMVLGADKELDWDECWIPAEVIKSPKFSVTLYCDNRVTTNMVTIPVDPSGYTEKITNQQVTPTVIEQMDSLMKRYALVCNAILQDCSKIQQEIKGGNSNGE
jgi:hypothetical protein